MVASFALVGCVHTTLRFVVSLAKRGITVYATSQAGPRKSMATP
jgi:hypothetical protein